MQDVIVVGCGPVGALMANLLARQGLTAMVLEKEAHMHPLPRAVHIDHEMLRLFQSAGVIERVLPGLRETDGHLHIGADHGVIRYMGTVGKPRPFGWANDYFFYQPELEQHLRDGFADNDAITLLTGAEFESLSQEGDVVTVSYRSGGELHEAQARWVVGADGSRSQVRKHLGIALEDLDFEEPWLVVDVDAGGDVKFPDLSGVPAEADLQRLSVMMCDPLRPATIVPGRGSHRRWEFMLLPGEDDEEMMRPAAVSRLLAPYLSDVPHKVVRAATYRFHGLVSEQWQQGNVFLAGDAAHQTPPFFGQGMCHGFRDVANLAWKMAEILKNGAQPGILETYQPERDPHVRAVIGAALNVGRYICVLDPDEAAERDRVMRERATFGTSETAGDLIPPILEGIVMNSAGAGERFIQPRVDDSSLLDELTGGGWRLFVRDDSASSATDVTMFNLARNKGLGEVLGWLDARGVDAVLVRPDHYVFGTAKGSSKKLLEARRSALGLGEANAQVAA